MPTPKTCMPGCRLSVVAVSLPPRVMVVTPTAPVGAVAPELLLVLMMVVPPVERARALLSTTVPLRTLNAPVKFEPVWLSAPRTREPVPVLSSPLPPSATVPIRFSTPAPCVAVLPVLMTAPAPEIVVVPEMPKDPAPMLPIGPLVSVSAELALRVRAFATAPNCVPNMSMFAVVEAARS